VQTTLFKEVKVMDTVDKQCAKIVKKNLLIENENLIANCLSNQLLYDVEKSRCLDLEAELSKVHNESKHISKLEREYLNLLTQIKDLKAQLEGNLKVAARSSVKTKVLALGMYATDVEPIPPRLKNNRSAHLDYMYHLKESVETVREIVEEAKVIPSLGVRPVSTMQAVKALEAIQSTLGSLQLKSVNNKKVEDHPRTNNLNKTKHIWKPKGKLSDNSLNKTKQVWKAMGMLFANVGYQWRPTGKKFALEVEQCPALSFMGNVVQIILWYLDSGCSKHMTGNRSKLKNFVEKFIGTVRFGNDHVGAIMGYGDYMIGDSVISRVLLLGGLDTIILKKFALAELCPLTRLPVTCGTDHLMVFGLRLLKTYDGESLKAQELCEKVHQDGNNHVGAIMGYGDYIISNSVISIHSCFVRDMNSEDLGRVFESTTKEPMNVSLAEPNQVNQPPDHLRKWTKDHPLDNIIGNPSRPVSTRKQLAFDALWCCYHTVLSKVKPKNFKMAVNEDSWFEAMQDEIHELDRLKVWELVPRSNYVMVIGLKWIYKVKLDEYGDVLKNKARLVAKGYRQEEGTDFEESLKQRSMAISTTEAEYIAMSR
ncbi:retrovirus-related pol polyprotein from transposon TNT 1-94, partial [Tanacetum coccineum]